MIREAVTDWLDEREDAIFFWVMAGLVGMVVLFLAGVVFVVIHAATSHAEPSLFCPSGSELHQSPATVMVGKVSKEGVKFTCDGAVTDA